MRRKIAIVVVMLLLSVFGSAGVAMARTNSNPVRTSLGYDDDGNSTSNFTSLAAGGTTAVIMNDWCQSGTNATCNGYQSGTVSAGMTPYVYRDLTSVRSDDCVPAGSGQSHPSTSCISGGFNLNNAPAADICPSSVVDAPTFSGGLPFCYVWQNHPDWILKDTSGNYLEESGFGVQYETDYGNVSYQNAWASQMLADASTYGWTAVFGDNALVTNDDYGIAEKYQTNASVDTAMGAMIQNVGTKLKNAGMEFVPNVGYMNIEPQLWDLWLPYTTGEMNQHDVGGTTILDAEQNTCLSTSGAHCMFNNPSGSGPFDIYDGPAGSSGSPPTVNTDAATSVSTTSATLNGDTVPNGADTTCHFNYGTTTGYGSTTTGQDEGSGTSDENFNAALTGLSSGTTYHFQAECSNSQGDVTGADQQFTTTSSTPPTVNTDTVSGIKNYGAHFNGDVNPNGLDTTCHFNWGTTTAYGNVTPNQDKGSGTTDIVVASTRTDLSPNTTYHYQAECSNADGDVTGGDQSFITTQTPAVPVPNTDAATGVTSSTATMNGDVFPQGASTTCHMNWGKQNPPTGNASPNHSEGSGYGNVTDHWSLTGLPNNTQFWFQMECSNSFGDVKGNVQTFTT